MTMNLRKLCLCLICATLCHAARADDIGGIKEGITEAVEDAYEDAKNAYDKLPETGKFAVGAGAGFVGSRVAVSSAVTGVKVAGAAFVVSEALNYAGVFDSISRDNKAFLGNVKNSALKSVNNVRQTVRRRLAPNGIKATIESAVTTEKMATLGVAAGAFVGFMV